MKYTQLPSVSGSRKSPLGVHLISESPSQLVLNFYFRMTRYLHLDSIENFLERAEHMANALNRPMHTALYLKFRSIYPGMESQREHRLVGFAANSKLLERLGTLEGCSLLSKKPMNNVRGRIGNYRLFENPLCDDDEMISIFKVKIINPDNIDADWKD